MIRPLRWAAAVAAVAAVAGYAWVNLAPSDPAVWHADPLTAEGTGRPNQHRVQPPDVGGGDAISAVYPVTPSALMAAFDAVALAHPRTRRLAGDPGDLHVTYVARTPVMGYPDYVSVKAVPAGENGAALAIWSRSRFGYGDIGVNRDRVERWLAALEARLG